MDFVPFSADLVYKTTPRVSKTLQSGGKSSGKFLKTVGVSEKPLGLITRSCRKVEVGRRAPAEWVDLSGCNDRLAGFVHAITTLPSLGGRARAREISLDGSASVQDRQRRGLSATTGRVRAPFAQGLQQPFGMDRRLAVMASRRVASMRSCTPTLRESHPALPAPLSPTEPM